MTRPATPAPRASTVANVAPTVTLTGATNVDEGSTHTYTFTVTDPGVDTFTVDTGFPTATRSRATTARYVAGSLVGQRGRRQLRVHLPRRPGDRPTSRSRSPTPTAPATRHRRPSRRRPSPMSRRLSPRRADQTADEGASTSFSLGSFTDPGPDATWAVDVDWGDGTPTTTFDKTADRHARHQEPHLRRRARRPHGHRQGHRQGRRQRHARRSASTSTTSPRRSRWTRTTCSVNEGYDAHLQLHDQRSRRRRRRLSHHELRRQRRQGRRDEQHGHQRLVRVHLPRRPRHVRRCRPLRPTPTTTPGTSQPRR